MNENGSMYSFTIACPFQPQYCWGKKNQPYKNFEKGSLCKACPGKVQLFLEKMLRKSNLPLTSQPGYQSESRYCKTGNLRQAKEKIAK